MTDVPLREIASQIDFFSKGIRPFCQAAPSRSIFEPILLPVNLSDNSAAGNSAEISFVFSKTRSITIFSLKS